MNRSWTGAVNLAAAAGVTLTALVGCDEDFGKRCGAGTLEQNGECVPESPGGTSLSCGTGTVERDGACVPTMTLSCGAGTRESGGLCVPTSTGTGLICGPGTMQEGLQCVPEDLPPEIASVEGLKAYACRSNRCSATLALDYWTRQAPLIDGTDWDTHAMVRTVTFVEVGAVQMGSSVTFDELIFRVTDDQGGSWDCKGGDPCPGLMLEAGRPVTLKLINLANNLAPHYLTAAPFYRTVAWRRVLTPDAEYKAPAFDAVGLKRGTSQLEATLSFVPIVPGTFESYCQLGVMDGARFPDIIAGAVTPNYASGHAGAGMHAKLEITDPMGLFAGHTLSQDQLIDRPAELDRDPRLASSWWSNPTLNQGRCCTDVVVDLAEPSDTEFVFEVGGERLDEAHPLVLAKDFGYKLSFRNTSATRKHYFSAPKFFETTLMRRAEDSHAYVVAPYLFEAAPLAGKQVDAYVVPTVAARFGTYCSIGVREGVHGAPDLATGHAGAGMRAPVLVTTTTTSTGT